MSLFRPLSLDPACEAWAGNCGRLAKDLVALAPLSPLLEGSRRGTLQVACRFPLTDVK
jgi:hypothetical protein